MKSNYSITQLLITQIAVEIPAIETTRDQRMKVFLNWVIKMKSMS